MSLAWAHSIRAMYFARTCTFEYFSSIDIDKSHWYSFGILDRRGRHGASRASHDSENRYFSAFGRIESPSSILRLLE